MLQSDLNHAVGFCCGRPALFRFRDRPSHGFLRVEVLSGGQRIQEMSRMDVQWAGDENAVNVLHVQQAAMVVERLNLRRQLFRFFAAAGVNIRDRHELHVRNSQHLVQKFLAASAHADHPHANTIVRAERSRSRAGGQNCRAHRGVF